MSQSTPHRRLAHFCRLAALGLITACVLLAAAGRAFAGDDGGFSGRVTHGDSSDPIAGVQVVITDESQQVHRTLTNVAGGFAFVGLTAGRYEAIFSRSGLDTVEFLFVVCPEAQTYADPHMFDAPTVCGNCPYHRPPTPRIVGSATSYYAVDAGDSTHPFMNSCL